MIHKIFNVINNPKRYVSRLKHTVSKRLKSTERLLCPVFQGTSFFLQSQMDINIYSLWYKPEFNKFSGGYYPKINQVRRQICNLESWDNTRRDMLILLLRTIVERNVEGDIVELGVYKGFTAKLIHYYVPERKLHLFDTFEGFTNRSVVSEKINTNKTISAISFSDTTLDNVKKYIAPINNTVLYYKGYFPESIPEEFRYKQFAFVHLDADLYDPIMYGLKYFYPRIKCGGMILIHDYNAWLGTRKAVDEFFSDKKELPIPMPDKSGSALIIKQADLE